MLAKVLTGTTIGLDGQLIDVEVDVASRGFPTLTIVGLPGKAVDEAKDRVRTAIVNASCEMPDSRITVNLAPADIPKLGSGFDLPMAVGILAASGMIQREKLPQSLFIGELSLEGHVRRVPGVLSVVLMAKEKRIQDIYVPLENAYEASLIEGVTIYPVHTLLDLILHLNGQTILPMQPSISLDEVISNPKGITDFADIKGQEFAKRALEIAAAGFHNLHMKGPPGTGKTLLSRAFSSILPPMDRDEILEVSKIYSITGLLQGQSFMIERPFRAPHHTTSRIGLIGGGSHPGPGEISLAHRGVLFLDELPEFPRNVLESLRQPVEDGIVTVSRAVGSITFPSRFQLLAASNPCPCGYFGHPKKQCSCLPGTIMKYSKKVSGPLLDRIDLHITVPILEEGKLFDRISGEKSEVVRKRVVAARLRQQKRFIKSTTKTNGEMTPLDIKYLCMMSPQAEEFMRAAVSRLALSARTYYRMVKVSQTIADLGSSDTIELPHVSEALQFRQTGE